MKGQMNLFPEEYIKDSDCTKDTPVVHGKPDTPIYGMGARIKPRVPGRQDTEHFKSIYLDSLLPLEEYDLIAILLSGGKDSIACYYKLLESVQLCYVHFLNTKAVCWNQGIIPRGF